MKLNMNWLEKHDPIQEHAAMHWEQGLPLGNGKIGAMVWGGGAHRPLTVSLDQAEIWDMRTWLPAGDKTWTEYKALLEQDRGDEVEGFAYGPKDIHTTRVPVGRVELLTDDRIVKHTSRLRLLEARCEGTLTTENGEIPYAVWTVATHQLAVIECADEKVQPNWKFICRDGDYTEADIKDTTVYPCYGGHMPTLTQRSRDWGYPDMAEDERDGIHLYRQDIPESGGFAVACVRQPGCWLISIRWSKESAKAAGEMALDEVREGMRIGIDALRQLHEMWWADYFGASAITIPDTRLEGYYYLQTYMLGCCTRPEGPHMTLCGPWTDDTNFAPICDNDYHWNNEQEMQVWPVYTGNRLAFGEPIFRMIEENLDTLKQVCKLHFKVDGAFLTHSTDPLLRPTYASVDNFEFNGLPWVCFHYWKHYRFTMDKDFLEKRAYPVMKLAVVPMLSELVEGEDGFLHLPWTSSPEYHGINETIRWIKKEAPDWKHRFGPDATIDLALLRWLLKTLCEVSELLKVDEELRWEWQATLDRLTPYARDSLGGLAVRGDVNLITTHRHMSHLFPIYPLGEWTMADHAEDIKRCLDVIGTMGHGEWMGWSFPWASLIYGRAGRPACSRNLLLDYIDRYVTETGMHYQGPQGMCDVSLYGDGGGNWGQTIEAQLGVPEAIHELLIRTENGVTRVFRDCPPAWAECGFTGLRCEGAFLVDAMRDDYRTNFVRVTSEAGGRIVIDTDLGEGELHGPVMFENGVYVADMWPGETLEFWRGERANDGFVPLDGNPTEVNYWGVKRVRRF